jgi:hypothetical protein
MYKEKLNDLLKEMCAHMNAKQKEKFIEDNFLITLDQYKSLDDQSCKSYYEMLTYTDMEFHDGYKIYENSKYKVRVTSENKVSFTIKGFDQWKR